MMPHVTDVLIECESYFDNKADADHDQDGYVPNEEMKLLTRVRAALASKPQEGWQEISTAPDRQRIMVYNGAVHEMYRKGGFWFDPAGRKVPASLWPTKWQPLPAPPKEGQE